MDVKDIRVYLDDLEERLDDETEQTLFRQWYDFVERKVTSSYFDPSRPVKRESRLAWEPMLLNDALKSYDNMIYSQLQRCNEQLRDGGGELLVFRSNYGTGILPSLFGCEIREMPYEQNSLPSPLPVDAEALRELLEDVKAGKRTIDVKSGLPGKCFEAAGYLRELMKDYPKLSRYLHIYTPDTEGPCSIAEEVLGSELYCMFYEEEELIHDLLDVITDTFIRFVRAWHAEFLPVDDTHAIDLGLLHRGHILIREDSATNISPDMYEEFIMPRDQKILDAFGGGILHFCGKGDHLIPKFAQLNGFYALNMSQPDWNDMNTIYSNTIDKGIEIIGMPRFEIRRCNREGIHLKGLVQAGISISAWMGEPEEEGE